MKIGLIDVDSKIANLALMKLSAWHKSRGDSVEWYDIFGEYDRVYLSKVFTFAPDYDQVINNASEIVRGGTGYGVDNKLPDYVDRTQPDYSIYPNWPKDTAIGFLTRGCPNRCAWCIVPKKEGQIRPYMTIEEVTQGYKYKKAVLLDNNIIAAGDYAREQFKLIVEHGVRIDFNQAMDARLISDDWARILSHVKWINNTVRFGCDTPAQIGHCERAIFFLRRHGFKGEVMLYTLIQGSLEECYDRISRWKSWQNVTCQSQPKLNLNGRTILPQWQKDLAHWSNRRWLYKACDFKDFEPRKGFKCSSYFAGN